MNLVPKMTDVALARAEERAQRHVDRCAVCKGVSSPTKAHTVRLLAELRKVLQEHVKRCHTCRTRGEAAQLAHYKVILQVYIIGGAQL